MASPSYTILIADDETELMDALAQYFRKENLTLVKAENGAQALELFETRHPDLVLLDFSGSGDDFQVSEEEINIGISVMKGNTALKDAINSYLSDKTAEDFNALMQEAIKVQPLSE